MERRIHRRFPRRIELRFWRPGEVQGHTGYTSNISKSGLFLNSAIALMPGERLRLEVVDRESGFVAEGRVARVHRVALALRQVDQQGAGVRFLPPEELIENLVPLARMAGPVTLSERRLPPVPFGEEPRLAASAAGPERGGGGVGGTGESGESGESGEDRQSGSRGASRRTAGNVVPGGSGATGDKDDAASAAAPATPATVVDPERIVPVQFPDPASFLSTFHRDISAGGLFIATPHPMPLQATVWVEMQLPIPGERPRRFAARVVQRFEPQAAVGDGRNNLSGMAVLFLDPEKVLAELRPLLAVLRR